MTQLKENKPSTILFRERRKSDRNFLVIVFFLITHISGSVWWASRITTRQEFIIKTQEGIALEIKEKMDDRYYGRDASRDFAIRDQKDREQDERLRAIETRLTTIPMKIPPPEVDHRLFLLEKEIESLRKKTR